MREVLKTGHLNWQHMAWAGGLNIIYMAIAGCIFTWMLQTTKKRGLLTKFATQ
jgi:ABC-2 type transport system permease protein